MELIRADHAPVAEHAVRAELPAGGHEAANVQQHLDALFVEELFVLGQQRVVPHPKADGRRHVDFQVAVLP